LYEFLLLLLLLLWKEKSRFAGVYCIGGDKPEWSC